MAFLKDKFASLNADYPEESNALVVHVMKETFELAKDPVNKQISKLESDLQKHQKIVNKWTKGIKLKTLKLVLIFKK